MEPLVSSVVLRVTVIQHEHNEKITKKQACILCDQPVLPADYPNDRPLSMMAKSRLFPIRGRFFSRFSFAPRLRVFFLEHHLNPSLFFGMMFFLGAPHQFFFFYKFLKFMC